MDVNRVHEGKGLAGNARASRADPSAGMIRLSGPGGSGEEGERLIGSIADVKASDSKAALRNCGNRSGPLTRRSRASCGFGLPIAPLRRCLGAYCSTAGAEPGKAYLKLRNIMLSLAFLGSPGDVDHGLRTM